MNDYICLLFYFYLFYDQNGQGRDSQRSQNRKSLGDKEQRKKSERLRDKNEEREQRLKQEFYPKNETEIDYQKD